MTPDEEVMMNRLQPADLEEAKVWIAELRNQVELYRDQSIAITEPLKNRLAEKDGVIYERDCKIGELQDALKRERRILDHFMDQQAKERY